MAPLLSLFARQRDFDTNGRAKTVGIACVREGPVLTVSGNAWSEFTGAIKRGEFDL